MNVDPFFTPLEDPVYPFSMQVVRAAVLLLLAPLAARADDALTIKDLQGTWKGARFTEGDGSNASNGVKVEFTFKDNTLVCRKEPQGSIGEATFTLSADGKSIDATGTSGGYRNKTYLGILKLDGDKLFWCMTGSGAKDQKRPTGFTGNPGSAQYLIVLTRQKP
jgi:uncharacterized protein (TIGR03067 family)